MKEWLYKISDWFCGAFYTLMLCLGVFVFCYLFGCLVSTVARLLWFAWTSCL